jgi:competence protein ComEA
MLLPRRFPIWLMFCASFITALIFLTGPGIAAKTKAPLVDLNTASEQELESLKGIGPATAKKIIEARPYKSMADLSKAGLTAKNIEALKPLVTVSPAKETAPPAAKVPQKQVQTPESSKLIDLNNASQQELETLPGVGKISANKIIAARPYKSVNDLAKAGLATKNIEVLKPLVTANPVKETPPAGAVTKKQAQTAEPAKLIDLNTASQPELEALPGVGKVTAKKIIAARPYTSVDELSKAGIAAKSIEALKPLVIVSPPRPLSTTPVTPAKSAPTPAPATTAAPTTAPPAATKAETPPEPKAAAPAVKLAPGQLVNINTASKEMLEALPEIGPVKAQAIINNRPYKKIDDIMKVKGIKEGTFGKIKDMITVN